MILVYFAPVPWDSYPQRPHYIAQHFLRRGGHRVVWIDPYPTRLPRLRDLYRPRSTPALGPVCPGDLHVVSVHALPFEPLAAGAWINRTLVWSALARRMHPLVSDGSIAIGIGRPSALALSALRELRPVWAFYDAMDDFPEFYSGVSKRSAQRSEEQIAKAVDVVVTASSALWGKFASAGSRRSMIHNAFDMSPLPSLPIARGGHRVFGYVGCVGAWFDWPLVARLADAVPDASVRVVGPCFSRPPRHLPSNVHLFPACSAGQAIEHLKGFSVGLVPFKLIPLTDAVDPIKYYGYRAMGLPVLSTAFGEMARRGIEDRTFIVDRDAALAETARATLDAGAPTGASVLAFRREHAWEHRLDKAHLFDRAAL